MYEKPFMVVVFIHFSYNKDCCGNKICSHNSLDRLNAVVDSSYLFTCW